MTRILTTGVFDLVHPNHVRFFEECKKHGDELIVGVLSSKLCTYKRQPILSDEERMTMVKALKIVDDVVLVDSLEAHISVIRSFKPDVYVHGMDFWNPGSKEIMQAMDEIGSKIILIPRQKGLSTTELKKKIETQGKIIKPIMNRVYFKYSEEDQYKLGQKLAEKESEAKWPKEIVVVPIPNSGKLFAKGYSERLKLPYKEVILKKDKKRSLETMDENERDEYLKTCFSYNTTSIPEDIILVDEAVVTGKTMSVIVQKLKKLGVKNVIARIVAPIKPENRELFSKLGLIDFKSLEEKDFK